MVACYGVAVLRGRATRAGGSATLRVRVRFDEWHDEGRRRRRAAERPVAASATPIGGGAGRGGTWAEWWRGKGTGGRVTAVPRRRGILGPKCRPGRGL